MVFSQALRIFGKTLLGAGICLLPLANLACLESPDAPELSGETAKITVCAAQKDSSCASPLQLSPADSFTLYAQISPESAAEKLSIAWKSNGKVLSSAPTFSTDFSRAPDTLWVKDSQGNGVDLPVLFLFDSAPVMDTIFSPQDGAAFFGDSTTAFRFAYAASDADASDLLFFTLVLDSIPFDAGTLTEVFTSGFSAGEHTFQVIVEDSYGLSDSSKTVRFFVGSVE